MSRFVHILQAFVRAARGRRRQRPADRLAQGDTPALPRTEEEVDRVAAGLGFAVPDACMPGVVANLAILAGHATTLRHPAAGKRS